MTPKNKLFIGILAFMLIVNILVIFDINQFYIRAILAFIFIITIPGLLIMLCLKIRNINFWEYLVYTVGLSVSFIMFAGLAVNWILPWLNITDKPLSLYPILICFDTILLVLWLIAQRRNEDNVHLLIFPFEEYQKEGRKKLKFFPKFPQLSWLDRIFIIIPIFFPFMAVIGAFLLNNHGTNIVTMIMLGAIAVYVFLVVIFRDKLNENVFPWALYWMGLALLLMYSMRSWYFMGSDVVSEYHFFDLAIKNSIWDITKYTQGYNVCLSVSILPAILNLFINLDSLLIFKLISPLIFSIILIIIYLFFKNFSNTFFSFLAGFFFMSQVDYMSVMPSVIRQEIALLFFGLMLLVLFSKEINPKIKNLLFVIFGFSMIVSHYSTSYIALALFLFTYILTLIYKLYENRKIKKEKLKLEQKSEFYLTGALVLILLIFGFLWYSQITNASSNIIDFTHNSLNNFNNLFREDMQMQGQSFLDQFRLEPAQKDANAMLQQELVSIQNKTNSVNTYPPEIFKDSSIKFIPLELTKSKFKMTETNKIYLVLGIIKKLGYIFIFIGLIFSLFLSKKKKDTEYFLLSLIGLIFFIFMVLITLIPLGSISYGTLRLYQQGLMVMSIFSIIGLEFSFKKLPKGIRIIIIVLFLVIYFLIFTGFFNQLIGNNIPFSNLNNFGHSYNIYFISNTEINSIQWLSNENITKKLYASRIYKSPFQTFGSLPYPDWNIFPQILRKNSYVYAGNSETVFKKAYTLIQGGSIPYNFPTEFLNDNKNKIYNNGGSEIFK